MAKLLRLVEPNAAPAAAEYFKKSRRVEFVIFISFWI